MSLTSLNTASAANEGRVLTVKHPVERTALKTADGTLVTLTLLGQDSEVYVKADLDMQRATFERVTTGAPYSPAESHEERNRVYAACTVAWTGVPQGWIDGTKDETPAPFTKANAAKLYGNPGVKWLRDQVEKFIGERAHFLQVADDS